MKVVHSSKTSVDEAVRDVRACLAAPDAKLVVFFASSHYPPEGLAKAVHGAFGGVPTIGCTTAGELVSGRMLKESLVAMALGPSVLSDVQVEILTDTDDVPRGLEKAFAAFEKSTSTPMSDLDPAAHVGLVLADGLSGAEEKLMEGLGDRTNVAFVGGSAGDDLAFEATHVFLNGRAHTKAAVLALLKPATTFSVVKTQSFRVLPKKLLATKVDEATRTVHEFNGRSAALEYARALGVEPDTLADCFMRHPLGLMVTDTEPFVRSPQQVQGESVVFYCAVREGMELSVLESADIVADTKSALDDAAKSGGEVCGLLNFHCILRTLQLENTKKTESYGGLFAMPMIGFSTYGEAYVGHINQTSTMLVFHR